MFYKIWSCSSEPSLFAIISVTQATYKKTSGHNFLLKFKIPQMLKLYELDKNNLFFQHVNMNELRHDVWKICTTITINVCLNNYTYYSLIEHQSLHNDCACQYLIDTT